MKSRKLKRKVVTAKQETRATVPIARDDRLSAIVPIDRICVEGQETIVRDELFLELCDSVKQNGVLQPLLLRRVCEEDSSFGGVYLLVAGKRRLEAARLAGHRAVPSYIVTMDAKEAAVTAYLTDSNCAQRNMFELSDALADMQHRFGMSIQEIATRVGKTELYTAGKLLLQRYSAGERRSILKNGLSENAALLLLQIRDQKQRAVAVARVCEKKMEDKAVADYVQSILSGSIPSPKNALTDMRLLYNSVDRLMTALRRSGANADMERHEFANETVVTIRVLHSDKCKQTK